MSLINDALKRAREAQQQTPPKPTPSLQFRPVDTLPVKKGVPWMIPAGLALVVVVVLVAWWLNRNSGAIPVEARSSAPAAAPVAAPTPVAPVTTTPAPKSTSTPSPETAVDTGGNPANPVSITTTPAESTAGTTSHETLSTVAVTVEPPKPVAPKLQAIFFNPTRPSAIISGRTVFTGDKVGDQRVVAITQGSATLTGQGQTNVLVLDP